MAGKKVSRKGKGSYAAYKAMNSFAKNKKRSIEQHLKRCPDDENARKALGDVSKAKPRATPSRIKARLDSWCATNDKGEYQGNRSRNAFSGRLSAWGKFTQTAARFSKGVAKARAHDIHGKLFGAPCNPQQVWAGWAEFNQPKPQQIPKATNKNNKHKNNKRK